MNPNFINQSQHDDEFDVEENGESAVFDPLASGSGTQRRFGGMLVMGAVIIAAAGGLYTMRMMSRMSAAEASTMEIDSAVSAFLETMERNRGDDADGAVAVLENDYTEIQVHPNDVARDPFELMSVRLDLDPDATVTEPTRNGRKPSEIDADRRRAIQVSSQRLVLKSTMLGRSPLAIIDGNIMKLDDTFSSTDGEYTYRVMAVKESTVELSVEHEELVGDPEIVILVVER